MFDFVFQERFFVNFYYLFNFECIKNIKTKFNEFCEKIQYLN